MREITNLTTTSSQPKQTQSSRRDVKSLESGDTPVSLQEQQDKKLTSLDKRCVEHQVRSETGDGDHESEDLSEDTGENIRQVVHKQIMRDTLL